MSLYKDASLVMIPSAYKDGKLYSVRPVPEYGAELVTNGTFDTDSDWTKGGGATISSGKANIIGDGSAFGYVEQTNVFVIGKTYRITLNAIINSGGGLNVKYNPSFASNIGSITKSGFYSFKYTAVVSGSIIIGRSTGGVPYDSSIDNVSVKEVLVDDGDFTFSRGSNLAATRVDVNGLIEKGRENLLLQSNQFDTTWSISGSTTLSSGQSGYDGSNNAWLLSKSGGEYRRIYQAVAISGVCTLSVYAKANTLNQITLRDGSTNALVRYDLSDGSLVGTAGSPITYSIVSVGNGWWRCSLTMSSSVQPSIYVEWSQSAAGSIYIQDAQLEQGLVATDYIETTTTSVSAGILEDMPRLDYSGSCPSLLLEPQRTNFVVNSEYFGASNWTPLRSSIALSSVTSPEGVGNAYKLTTDSTANNTHIIYYGGTLTSDTYSLSLYAKAAEFSKIGLGTGNLTLSAKFDLSSGSVITSGAHTASIESAGNDWYRCTIVTTTTTPIRIVLLDNDGNISFDGDGTSGLYIFGHQAEVGSYPTSYIPTYGTSQTRSLDVCDLNGMNAAGISTSNNWTYFIDVDDLETGTNGFYLYSTSGEILHLYSTSVGFRNTSNSTTYVASWSWLPYDGNNSRIKMIFRYDGNKLVAFINGVKKDEIDSSLLSSRFADPFDRDRFHWAGLSKWDTNQKAFFDTALTDSECIALTTI